jgi:tetratricopeptide (TPR) repeat protein
MRKPEATERRSRGAELSVARQTKPAFVGSPWFWPAIIFLIAAVLRLIYVGQVRYTPFFQTLGLDAQYFDRWARQLAAGRGTDGAFFMSPLYPYFLAGIYRLFGRDLLVVRLFQVVLGSFSCVLVYMIGREAFDRRVAVVAGLISACYGAFIFYDGSIILAPLLVFLNLLALLLLLRADAATKPVLFALSGAALGLAAIGRAAALVFVPAALWWIAVRQPRLPVREARPGASALPTTLRRAALLLGGIAVVIAPVTVRNLVASGDFVPITSNGGLNFYIGNSEISTGGYAKPEGLDLELDVEGKTIAERDLGRELSPSGVSGYWYGRARSFIAANPGRWLALLLRKLSFTVSSYELPQLENYYFQRSYSGLLSLPLPGFAIVAPLGVLGLALSFGRRRSRLLSFFLVAHVMSIVAFFVVARYRLPAVPALILGASFMIVDSYDRFRGGRLRSIWWAAPVLAILLFVVNANLYGVDRVRAFGQVHYRLGLIYGDRGEFDRAAAEYRLAIELDPEYTKSYLNLGAILAEVGRPDDAVEFFRRAVELDPGYSAARVNLAMVLRQQGSADEAITELRRVLESEPDNAMALTQLGVSLYREGRVEEAKAALDRAERFDHDGRERAEIRFYLALIERPTGSEVPIEALTAMSRADSLVQMGRAVEARRVLSEAAMAYPGSGEPLMKLAFVERDIGLLEEAIEHMRQALGVDPRLPHGHYTLGVFLNESGQHDAAIRAYEAELRIDPAFGPAQLNLAATYLFHLANKNLAIRHYREYIRLGGEPVDPMERALAGVSGDSG